jgi:hypothetical protein
MQARKVEPTGFLGDYSELEPGGGERALLYYINPDADLAAYERMIIDPVAIWFVEGSKASKAPEEEMEQLAVYLYDAMKTDLEKNWSLVEEPGPGTLRVRVALCEASKATAPGDIATTYIPPARVLGEIQQLATGTHLFVGKAVIEMEIVDPATGERLIAIVDHRKGGKTYKGSLDKWIDVKNACDLWAEAIAARLEELRGRDQ